MTTSDQAIERLSKMLRPEPCSQCANEATHFIASVYDDKVAINPLCDLHAPKSPFAKETQCPASTNPKA